MTQLTTLPVVLVLVVITLAQIGPSQTSPTPDDSAPDIPAWLGVLNSTGKICETGEGNDELGRKLGCTCKYPYHSPNTELIADCKKNTLGTEDTQLPKYVNVSSHLRTLDFADNRFLNITGETFGDISGLTELIFRNNLIHTVRDLAGPRLTKLDLSHNLITNLTNAAFNQCPKLQHLDLSFNHLAFIEAKVFATLKFLKILNLASNHVGMAVEFYDEYPFELKKLEWLEELNLNDNLLNDFPTASVLGGSPNLKRLFLRNNKIFKMPAELGAELPHLEELDLSGNLFNVISPNEFNGLKALKKLRLDGLRDLTMIEVHAFGGLEALEELSCEKNHRLESIDLGAFQGDPELNTSSSSPKIVRLSDNALTYIEFPLLSWKDLEILDMMRNPWACDCNLQWVASFRVHKPAEAAILIDSDFVCHTPPALKGTAVAEVEPDEMLCDSATAATIGVIGIAVFVFILTIFWTFLGLSYFGLIPNWFKRFNICGAGEDILKYSRVKPMRRSSARHPEEGEPEGGDLEWDTSDVAGGRR